VVPEAGRDDGGQQGAAGGAVPYLWISTWATAPAGLDTALDRFAAAPGMVLDLRMNGGGNSAHAAAVA
jgi:C-terminal processing protease CtpA/Prc